MNNLIIRDALQSIGNELKLGSVFYYSIFLYDHDFSETMYIILYYVREYIRQCLYPQDCNLSWMYELQINYNYNYNEWMSNVIFLLSKQMEMV